MKTSFLFLFTLSILAFGINDANAQDDNNVTPYQTFEGYSNPSSRSQMPVSISLANAEREVNKYASLAGFTAQYFSKADLLALLSQENCVGIRFYNCLNNSTSNNASIIAVAVKSNGSEICPLFGKQYLLSKNVSGTTIEAEHITKNQAKDLVVNLGKNTDIKSFSAFYSKANLSEMLNEGIDGLKLIPGSRLFEMRNSEGNNETKRYNTMMIIGVSASNGKLTDTGNAYAKTIEPCPTMCPDNKLLLNNPLF